MALNITETNAQIALLKRQSAAASHAVRLLSLYKAELTRFWSGIETDYLIKTIDTQIRSCEKLSGWADTLCCDIVQAIEETLSEEDAGDTETASD